MATLTKKDSYLTKREFDQICDELGLTYTWRPCINKKTNGTVHFAINDTFYFHFIIDWESKDIRVPCSLCDDLHIGRDKEGIYELTIANVEELLNSIASFKTVYKPVLANKL